MSKTELKLIKGKDNHLQLHYKEDDGSMTYEDIYFMGRYQVADYFLESIDFAWDFYGGGDNGEELSIETDVCCLPHCKETFIRKEDYYLLDRFFLLEKAAELVSSLKGGN